jgi:hypothetical protein
VLEHEPSRPEGWLSRALGEVTPAGLPVQVNSNGLVPALVVKAGAGSLLGFTALSTNVGAAFIQLHDANAVPANGAVPVFAFPIAANPGLLGPITYGFYGHSFHTGMVLAASSTAAALTILTAVFLFEAQYL